MKASKILGLPLVVSEQYPKGLGATVPELDISHAALVYDKTRFTMMVPALESKIPDLCQDGLQSVILFGIEVMRNVFKNFRIYRFSVTNKKAFFFWPMIE